MGTTSSQGALVRPQPIIKLYNFSIADEHLFVNNLFAYKFLKYHLIKTLR